MKAGTVAWTVLAAWLGFMLGLGIALRPSFTPLPPDEAGRVTQAWAQAVGDVPAPGLWLGRDCACDQPARATLQAWARQSGIPLHHAPVNVGVALIGSTGDLHYAGDASGLVAHCGGPRLMQALWQQAAGPPLLLSACACEGAAAPYS